MGIPSTTYTDSQPTGPLCAFILGINQETDFVLTDGGHCGEREEDRVIEVPPIAVDVGQVDLDPKLLLHLVVEVRVVHTTEFRLL